MDPYTKSPTAGRRGGIQRALCRYLGVALLMIAGLAATSAVQSAVFTCPTDDGDVQFQDRPCEASVSAKTSPDRFRAHSLAGRALPAGIHASWFESPDGVAHEAHCDEDGCECGPLQRRFDSGLTLAVADAMYLDGAWHRYQSSLDKLLDANKASNSVDESHFRAATEDAACEILMSQRILREFADSELRRLRRRAQDAEDLGRDDETSCDGFSEAACRDYEQLLMYRSISRDARALATPRGESLLGNLP